MASFHATAVSTASAGRQVDMRGMSRRVAVCSTGWCVGPSSPSPTESCVNTKMVGACMRAAMRRAFRAYSENIRKVAQYTRKPPCTTMPLAMAAMPNSRTP